MPARAQVLSTHSRVKDFRVLPPPQAARPSKTPATALEADKEGGLAQMGPRSQEPRCSVYCSLVQRLGAQVHFSAAQDAFPPSSQDTAEAGHLAHDNGPACRAEQDAPRAPRPLPLLSLSRRAPACPLADVAHPTQETARPGLKFPLSLSSHPRPLTLSSGQLGLVLCMLLSQPRGSRAMSCTSVCWPESPDGLTKG